MRIHARDGIFCLWGTFPRELGTRPQIKQTLRSLGATLIPNVTATTTATFWGAPYTLSPGDHMNAPFTHVPMLDAHAFELLLTQGYVDLPEAPANDDPVEAPITEQARFGEARSLLETPPSDAVWRQLCQRLDEASAEERAPLTDYLQRRLEREWTLEERATLCLATDTDLMNLARAQEPAPHLALVRAVELREHLSKRYIRDALLHPALPPLRSLAFDLEELVLPPSLARVLTTHARLGALHTLRLPGYDASTCKVLGTVGADHVPQLHRLELKNQQALVPPALNFLSLPLFSHVRELRIGLADRMDFLLFYAERYAKHLSKGVREHDWLATTFEALLSPAALPSIERVEVVFTLRDDPHHIPSPARLWRTLDACRDTREALIASRDVTVALPPRP